MTYRQLVLLVVIAFAVAFVAAQLTPVRAAECQIVRASWYGTESGDRTANGERFTGNDLTAAHRTLPFNTRLRVTYLGKSVVVRVNDRGPSTSFSPRRDLDLSRAAAQRIGLIAAGVRLVCVERL